MSEETETAKPRSRKIVLIPPSSVQPPELLSDGPLDPAKLEYANKYKVDGWKSRFEGGGRANSK